MLTREDDIDVHALRRQGWTISAIARHQGKDRKTIRAYLSGRESGIRATSWADPFDRFAAYCAQRLKDDPHLWASTLFDELPELGHDRSYPTMTRQLRARGLRPACEPCRPTKDRAVALIEHPPGEDAYPTVSPAARRGIAKRDGTFECYGRCHGSIRLTSVCRKSFRFRVARAAPWARQMEAICASNPSIGSPIWSRPPTTSA